jgi:hypothetical protein
MDKWLIAVDKMLGAFLGNPATVHEKWFVAGVGFLGLVWILRGAGSVFGVSKTTFYHAFVIGAIGVLLILVAAVAVSFYLPAWNEYIAWRGWMLAGSTAVVILILIVPLMMIFQKAGYLAGVFTWMAGIAAAAAIIVLFGSVVSGFASGSQGAGKGLGHNKEIENVLGQ